MGKQVTILGISGLILRSASQALGEHWDLRSILEDPAHVKSPIRRVAHSYHYLASKRHDIRNLEAGRTFADFKGYVEQDLWISLVVSVHRTARSRNPLFVAASPWDAPPTWAEFNPCGFAKILGVHHQKRLTSTNRVARK